MLKMKSAKSYKILVMLVAFAMSVVAAFALMAPATVKADATTAPAVSEYFNYGETTTAEFKDGKAVFTLTDADTIEFDNKLALDQLYFDYEMNANVKSITLKLTTDSYYVNGNKNKDGGYDTTIVNALTINADGTAKLNEIDLVLESSAMMPSSIAETSITFGALDGMLNVAFVNADKEVYMADTIATPYYNVKKTNAYNRLIGKLSIDVELVENAESAEFSIVGVAQNGMDYYTYNKVEALQTFALDTDNKLTQAIPAISLADDYKVVEESGQSKLIRYDDDCETIDYTVYSILGGYAKSKTKLALNQETDGWINPDASKYEVQLQKGQKILNIVEKAEEPNVLLSINVNVLDHTQKNDVKPEYITDANAIASYVNALTEKYVDKDGVCVALGTEIELPSMKDLVSDDTTSYDDLSFILYYSTPTSTVFSTNSSAMKLTLNNAGDYTFFVAFKDADGNGYEKNDFIEEKDGEEDKIKAGMEDLVFTIHVIDNAPIDITPASVQGKGYKGTSYTASKFKVNAEGCTITYELFYNESLIATEDSEGWVAIPKASNITDTEYEQDGYDYDDIQAINYNGELTFTPDKIGSYKIVCMATSKVTARDAVGSSIIRIESAPKVVKVDNHWLQNNVWSVVFLSIGTLCLIGIVVLLCIKPKEETDED